MKMPLIWSIVFLIALFGCEKEECVCVQDTTLKDIDGNVYETMTICGKVWMTENLRVTRFRNGDAIPNVASSTQWAGLNSPAWCHYNNDASNDGLYGKMYNGYTISDSRNLAPQGWHLPTKAEWEELLSCLGSDAGGKMKTTNIWQAPNTGATNSSGFDGIPGGVRGSDGGFQNLTSYGYWWSISPNPIVNTLVNTALNYNNSGLDIGYSPRFVGMSVRCIKD